MSHTEPETLIGEIARYLAAVDLFRAELCGPTWLPELRRGPLERNAYRFTPHSSLRLLEPCQAAGTDPLSGP